MTHIISINRSPVANLGIRLPLVPLTWLGPIRISPLPSWSNLCFITVLCQNSDYPDGYFFGTQGLACVGKAGKFKRSIPPWRYSWSLSHRLVYYRNAVYERVGDNGVVRDVPNWDMATKCPVTWESTPAATSTCSNQEIRDYVRKYLNNYGKYKFLTNNCHKFANRVSAFLFNSNCGRQFWPQWRIGSIKPIWNIYVISLF